MDDELVEWRDGRGCRAGCCESCRSVARPTAMIWGAVPRVPPGRNGNGGDDVNRRRFVQQTAGMVLAAAGSVRLGRRVSWAQEATPEASALAGLGLPEVHITLTAQGFTASPSSVAEGWTL